MATVWQATVLGPRPSDDAGNTPASGNETDAECVPNISLPERRKRLVAGVVQFAVGLALLAALVLTGLDRWWRLPLLLVFWGAASGFFQWRDKT